jgi:hypothetical protein
LVSYFLHKQYELIYGRNKNVPGNGFAGYVLLRHPGIDNGKKRSLKIWFLAMIKSATTVKSFLFILRPIFDIYFPHLIAE